MMNPLQMLAVLQQSNNPMAMLNSMSGNNPLLQRAMQMAQGKSPEQLRSVAANLAHQQGMTDAQLAEFLKQFGL